MKIVHISDSHGPDFTKNLEIPPCDVLVFSGDYSPYRGTLSDLATFLIWLEAQPAKKKIFIAGNHDLILDKKWCNSRSDIVNRMIAIQQYGDALKAMEAYEVIYLNNTDYVYEGIKFWGSPYSPTFGEDWAFNADRGMEIQKIWAKIPSDVDVLITHTPTYGFLDTIQPEYLRPGETDVHKGCYDLLSVIKRRLFKLKLHCSGHIHDNVGVVIGNISNKRRVMFSNGAVITNDGTQLITKPLIINL